MKLLVTGACGFVGSTLIRQFRLQHPDWGIVGIDNFSRPGSWLNKPILENECGVDLIHADIRNQADVSAFPVCDWIIDAAANPSVLAGVDGKTSTRQLVEHNLFGTVNLLEYCKAHQAGFILLSTSRVYSILPLTQLEMKVEEVSADGSRLRNRFVPDDRQEFPEGVSPAGISECYATTPPVSLYGSTKVTSEHLALEYGEAFGFPVWINRCGVLAGARQFGHPAQGIFAYWIHSFREGKPLKYIGFDGQGRQVRDCLHPRDLVLLLEKQIAETSGGAQMPRIINVSGGTENSCSLAELTAWCHSRFPGSKSANPIASPDARKFDLPWVVLDSSLARNAWSWEPATPLVDILNEIADFSETMENWLGVALYRELFLDFITPPIK
jgi:CDP-paratose 2-epimerase